MLLRQVVFDLDDTLIHNPDYEPIFTAISTEVGIPRERAQHFWRTNGGRVLADQFTQLCPDRSSDDLVEAFWQQARPSPITVLDGADQLLRDLYQADVRLLLTTGTEPERLDRVLDETGWRELFVSAQGSSKDHPKGPHHYLSFLQELDISPSAFAQTSAAVGDGVYDLRFARLAGIGLRIGLVGHEPDPARLAALRGEGPTHLVDDLAAARPLLLS